MSEVLSATMELPDPTVDVLDESYDGSTALPNPKHELYSRLLAMGLPVMDAHNRAGYKNMAGGTSSNAHHLSRRPDIAKRTIFLRQIIEGERAEMERARADVNETADHMSPEAAGFTATYVLNQFKQNLIIARQKGDIRLANDTVKLIGEVLGLFGENKTKGGVPATSTQMGRPRKVEDNDSVSDPAKIIISLGASLDAATGNGDRTSDRELRDITPETGSPAGKSKRFKRHSGATPVPTTGDGSS